LLSYIVYSALRPAFSPPSPLTRAFSPRSQLVVGKETRCNVLCDLTYNAEQVEAFKEKIDDNYVVTWVMDNLPGAVRMYDRENPDEEHYSRGCELGLTLPSEAEGKDGKQRLLFNHFLFVVSYHQEDGKEEAEPTDAAAAAAGVRYRVVGFEVEPYSVAHAKADASKGWAGNLKTCSADAPVTHDADPQSIDSPDTQVVFTYDVVWRKSPVAWAARWDLYLAGSTGDEIHWFSVGNSVMIALFMAGIIAAVLVSVLNRDIARYNNAEAASKEDMTEETGWKLVHGDVFRPPAGFFGPMFLSVFVGGGVQVLAMAALVLILAVLGFLSPANQGSVVTAFILLFVFMGIAAGYTSSWVYKMFKGKAWKRNTFLTAFSLSGGLLTATMIINAAVWSVQSSMAIPFVSFLLLLGLWLVICVPLVAVGSWLGFRSEDTKHPVRVNNIPRQIPTQPWYLHPVLAVLLGGVLPFGAVFVELHFVMSSLWLAQLNFVFRFLLIVLAILVITCSEISIVMTYFQLCAEDYNWWWRSFLTPGVSGLYVLLYSAVYFVTRLEITSPVSATLYFGYMAMISWCVTVPPRPDRGRITHLLPALFPPQVLFPLHGRRGLLVDPRLQQPYLRLTEGRLRARADRRAMPLPERVGSGVAAGGSMEGGELPRVRQCEGGSA
jgi:transmembrane 9 superfamily protein 2/4